MDTSLKYIKMCEKAEEIQSQGSKHYGDTMCFSAWSGREEVWLPRQDQLQEMLDDYSPVRFAWALIDSDKMNTNCLSRFSHKEMEKMWLAFVMKEKFNKIWNGENWMEVTHAEEEA